MLPPKLIVSPIDFSDPSHEALDTASSLASCMDAELLLVHVVPMLPRLPSPATIFNEAEFEQELHKDAEQRLRKLAFQLASKGVKAETEVGTANDAAMEIIRIADEHKADLIVIATHGMTGLRRLAFGSVTEKIVRLSTLPVLVLRADAAGKSAEETPGASAAAAGR
jgi:nucleotide-binding universal stress UspA family protein